MSFVAKIFVDPDKVGPGCEPFDLISGTDGTGIYGQNCNANDFGNNTPFLVDVSVEDLTNINGFTFTAPSPLTKVVKIVSKGVCSSVITGLTIGAPYVWDLFNKTDHQPPS